MIVMEGMMWGQKPQQQLSSSSSQGSRTLCRKQQ
jgi:hypothetical protein